MINTVKYYAKSQFGYLQQFIAAPRTVGTLVPSSPWLCDAMLAEVEWQKVLNIAELGAADGALTKKILSRMRGDAKLQAYEIQEYFAKELQKITDERLQVMAHSAEKLDQHYDVVFSCLPLLSIPTRMSVKILQQTQRCLHQQNGVLILFQYTPLSEALLSRYFTWKKRWIIKNIPPAIVYICRPKMDL